MAFLDSDDVWLPWTLATFDRAIREHNFPCVLGGKFVRVSRDSLNLPRFRKTTYQALQFADYLASSHYSCSVGSGTCVLDRKVLSTTGFLEKCNHSQDHDLILRMGCARGFMQILSPMTVGWRRHSASETADFSAASPALCGLLERERRLLSRWPRPGSGAPSHPCTPHKADRAAMCTTGRTSTHMGDILVHLFMKSPADRRWKFLLGLPVLAAKKFIERLLRREPRVTYPKSVGSR